jgi:hypothetical protein
MTQYSTQTDNFLNTNRNIYEVVYLANGVNGDIVSTGNPLPVTLGSENITITGNVNFVDTVNVASSPENPVHIHTTEVGTSGLLTVPYLPVGGNVNVTNIIAVTGNVTANGIVNIGNLPATQTVNGSVFLSNGTIAVTQSGSWNINNFPATQTVNGSVFLSNSSIVVTGNVTANGIINVGNFPSTQTVNGTVNIGNTVQVNVTNFPVTQNVTIMKNGLAVSDTVGLPIRLINDEGLISCARGKPVTESDVLNAFLIDKSGASENLGNSAVTMSTVWEGTGLYPWNTFSGTGDKLYIKSVTNDPKVQGKSVTINGLDSNYDIIEESVTLHASNTMIAVSTVNNFYRINRLYLSGNNTNSLPHDYDIEVRYGSASGTLLSLFDAPWGRGQNCIYTVPRGYEAFILSMNGNSGKMDEITSSLWFHPYGGTWTLQKTFKFISGTFDHNFRTPLRVTEKTDVEIRAFALVESSRIGTEFQLLVLPKA